MNTVHAQRGGTLLGFVLGLVLGLGVALAVAMYVSKVPTPFSNKNQTRSAEQDVVESKKNKDWNPNGVLQPKAPATMPTDGQVPGPAPEATSAGSGATGAASPVQTPAANGHSAAGHSAAEPGRKDSKDAKELKPAVSADPLGDLAKAKTASTASTDASEPFVYFVQAGAYRSQEEADAQKAKLAMMGLEAKVSEREQAGRSVYRVRLGPFEDKTAAERVRGKLEVAKLENTLVRAQR